MKVGIERVMFILKKNPLEVSCQLKGMFFMPLEKTGIINVLCIFPDFVFILLPKHTVNPGESWHIKSYVYPEEESIGSFMSTQKEWFLCH